MNVCSEPGVQFPSNIASGLHTLEGCGSSYKFAWWDGTTSNLWYILLHILIMALLWLLFSYLVCGKAILSSAVCHVCFSLHGLQYTTVLQFAYEPHKIRSLAFTSMVWSKGSSVLHCCLLYGWGVCISWLHYGQYRPPSPHSPVTASTHRHFWPAKSTNMELCLLWDHSVHSWPIQPSPIAYWYHVRKWCKWNGLNPPKTTLSSHHSDVHRLRNPSFRGLRERAIYRA